MGANLEPVGEPLLVIVGPTAVGKTAFSLKLGVKFNSEIVSADSRLFYKGLDVGTDKPTATERDTLVHHLIDICRPDETITLGQYKRTAVEIVENIQRRGHLPLMVGGTGQYVRAVVEGWGIPEVAPQERLRKFLTSLNSDELVRWLHCLDPESASRIDHQNLRRIIRALEVTLVAGRPMSDLQRKSPPNYEVTILGLTCDRELLYDRIDARVDEMMAAGFLEEVERIQQAGFYRHLPSMSGLGYRQLWAYLAGECTLDSAVERIKYETHRFARQQYNWFRLDNSDIKWFDVQENGWEEAAERFVAKWLQTIDFPRSQPVESVKV